MSNIISPANKLSISNHFSTQLLDWIDSFESCFETAYLYLKTFEEIKIKNLICSKNLCQEKVVYECKCSIPAILMCQTHGLIHMGQHPSKTQTQLFLYQDICDQK